jgi:2',3'-cyclic-nucleotide 2'-phosphodiesterase (5'-nucleotidase family)
LNWFSRFIPALFLIGLIGCKSGQITWAPPNAGLMQLDSTFKDQDPTAIALISTYKITLDSQMNKIIGTCTYPMQKNRPEGLLGNWAADAVQWESSQTGHYKWHFTVLNHGGLRTDLPAGNITLGKIYEVMPFDNELVILGLTKKELLQVVEIIIAKNGDPISGIQISKSCDLKLSVLLNGVSLDSIQDSETIWMATSDYMANGGDDYGLLQNISNRKITGILIRDALVHYIDNKPAIEAALEGRIILCP